MKLQVNQAFKQNISETSHFSCSGPGIKEFAYTTQPLSRMTSSHHLQFLQPQEEASSRLRRKGTNCLISIVGKHSKVPKDSIQDNQGNSHFYCHLTYTDFFTQVVEFSCDLIPQERQEWRRCQYRNNSIILLHHNTKPWMNKFIHIDLVTHNGIVDYFTLCQIVIKRIHNYCTARSDTQ